MKKLLLFALGLSFVAPILAQVPAVPMTARPGGPIAGTTPSNTDNPEADRAHDALWTAWRAKPPEGLDRSKRAYWEWQDKVLKQFAVDTVAFAEKFPKDVRRWEAIVQMGYATPYYITGFKPDFDTHPIATNLIVDEAALAAFRARQYKLDREVILSADANDRQRNGAFTWMLTETVTSARKAGQPPDLAQFESLVDEVAAKLPDERGAVIASEYLGIYRQMSPAPAAKFAAKLEALPIGKAMVELEAKQARTREEANAAVLKRAADIGTIKFTAADGHPVDLAKLRGKVVLIDFWATWCGPCIKEIPNVVANYQKYHDKGFEVIGITLENSSLADGDAGDVKEKKLAAAKARMIAFTKKNGMVWPQQFDGQYWQNEFAVKYNIRAIPAMFLLDQDGNVVSSEARGPKLESEIKRLLKL